MLKLTTSFYRYLTFTYERVNYKSHVKKKSNLREICVDIILKRLFSCHSVLLKDSKKRQKIKIPPLNLVEFERTEQMKKSKQPMSDLVSYGGSIAVSSDDDSSTDNNEKQTHRKPRPIPPNFRCWESVNARNNSVNENTIEFKIVSYNVLAQYLIESHPYLYTECSPRDLKWKIRSTRLFEEIMVLAPDILCLQEVQLSHLQSFYSKLNDVGYSGIFKQKTGDRQDGCAIYFKKSSFELMDHLNVEFQQPSLPLLNRDNIGMMVKLAPRWGAHSPFVVATTHLLYNPKRPDIRLAQMQVFLAELDRFAFYRFCGHLPMILTGDFNSKPDSAVIKLLDEGHVSAKTLRDHSDWEEIGITDNCQHLPVYLNRRAGQNTRFEELGIYSTEYSDDYPEAASSNRSHTPGPLNKLFNSGDLWQTLQLASVYKMSKPDGKMEASTFQDYWITVDYIFFSYNTKLRLIDRLRLPTAEECSVLHCLPNAVFASDHLALAAVFELTVPTASKSDHEDNKDN